MKAKRVLIIDDDAGLTTLFRTILESAPGFVVQVENDAATALATARTFSPHLIFLDCRLPSTSGLTVATALRSGPVLGGVPIVFVTGELVRFGGTGCWFLNDCPVLPKPFSVDELWRMTCADLGRDVQIAA